ncbi:hypothetical protein ACFOY2_01745 [Nonomuraea purpurea]|uniref:Uncharacterized protein n=1 Tax=Nonomuraea purpurea TaxID=1849276 RepID=A0ABV8FW09_9ACTN
MFEHDDYHGIHAAPGTPQSTLIDWYPSISRAQQVRVRASTCNCSQLVYEYCATGGLSFIRRHDRSTSHTVITETEGMINRHAESLWLRILGGDAK